jgi:probable DNA metabolism protein
VRDVVIENGFAGWRLAARELIRADVRPQNVSWLESGDVQTQLLRGADFFSAASICDSSDGNHATIETHDTALAESRVPREFLRMAESVACHSDSGRWHALYRVLFRLTHGEPSLLEVATDPDVHRLFVMDKAIRREVHKMHAFVRFRAVESVAPAVDQREQSPTTYVAWFEPLHNVVERASGLFVRRFASMRWSILTPLCCAHWDGDAVRFTEGVSRAAAPREDELEELWRSYYAHIFNPARVATATMHAEMPRRYWVNLPEARLIGALTREAPARVTRMLTQLHERAAEIPAELRSRVGEVTVPERATGVSNVAYPAALDVPGVWDVVHDPGVTVAKLRAHEAFVSVSSSAEHAVNFRGHITVHDATIRLGTASWTDPTLLHRGVFYPDSANTAEERLQYYASRYSLVEVDSTYYAPPTRSMAAAWAARSPEHFVFDVKAFALMTEHGAETKRMPDWLRRLLPRSLAGTERIYANNLRARILDEVWSRFIGALAPLHEANKLGPILLQFPRWFTPSKQSAETLRVARERLGKLSAAVEFRNPEWVSERLATRTFALLERLQLTYVVVDAPPGTDSSMPPVAAITTPELSVVRLHGRRTAAWEARHSVVSERYRYLYDDSELREWTARVADIAWRLDKPRAQFPDMARVKQGVHVVFNNCHANYGTTNTEEITQMLIEFENQRRGTVN